jgi:hypothetical protein
MTFSVWHAQDVQHTFELQQVWVHIEGVPHTVRHFLGLWAVGSLVGTTLDVDLVSLRSLGVVRILVAMMDPKYLDKFNEARGSACLGVTATIKSKGYDLFFLREKPDFVHDPGFTPFFWKKKGDDASKEGPGPVSDDSHAPGRNASSLSARMDIDQLQSSTSSSHGKTVLGGSVGVSFGGSVGSFAFTPLNPNPLTPRGKEIVAKARLESPELIAAPKSDACMARTSRVSVLAQESRPCVQPSETYVGCAP